MSNYVELYKKYRPKTWEEVIGQDTVVNSMRNAVVNNEIPTGYLLSGPPGTGKALHKDTLIPTPNGFTTMGELKIGDYILAPNGKPTKVMYKYCPDDKNMYLMNFSNGEEVKSSGGHLWAATSMKSRKFHKTGKLSKTFKYHFNKHTLKVVQEADDFVDEDSLHLYLNCNKYLIDILTREGYTINKYSGRDIRPDCLFFYDSTFYNKVEVVFAMFNYFNNIENSLQDLKDLWTTEEMYERLQSDLPESFMIGTTDPIEYEEKELPIDPYILGLWLGDGSSSDTRLTQNHIDAQVMIDYVENNIDGYSIVYSGPSWRNDNTISDTTSRYRIVTTEGDSFRKLLIDNNLLNNKHIPEEYKYASIEQRLELLRGLLDTDGSADKDGFVRFSQTEARSHIVNDLSEIVSSLGCRVKESKIVNDNGNDVYYIIFRPSDKYRFFHLDRKQERLGHGCLYHTIESIEKIEDNPKDYFCIKVDNPDELFLCTKSFIPTHNTTIAKIMAKALNCEHTDENGNPCNQCSTCKAIDEDAQIGVKYISMANNGSVEDVRRIMEASRLSLPVKKQVWIMDETQNLSSAAQDALLIGLESDTQKSLFIFCTTDPHKIKPAVMSRLQQRNLNKVEFKTLGNYIISIIKKEGLQDKISKEQVLKAVQNADGSVRNAIRNIELLAAEGELPQEYAEKLINGILSGNIANVFTITEEMADNSQNFTQSIESLFKSFVEILKIQSTQNALNNKTWMADVATQVSGPYVLRSIDTLSNTINQISNRVVDTRVLTEVCLFKLTLSLLKERQRNNQ